HRWPHERLRFDPVGPADRTYGVARSGAARLGATAGPTAATGVGTGIPEQLQDFPCLRVSERRGALYHTHSFLILMLVVSDVLVLQHDGSLSSRRSQAMFEARNRARDRRRARTAHDAGSPVNDSRSRDGTCHGEGTHPAAREHASEFCRGMSVI